jgi:hypothetical protein
VKRTAIALSVCFGVVPSAAYAVDWSIQTTQSETVEFNDNQFLRTPPTGGSIGSYSTLTANAEARTYDSKFDLNSDGTYNKYWGPGVDGLPSETLNYGFKAHYELDGKNNFDREFVESSWRQQSTALALLNDLGIAAPVNGFLDTLTASGGIDRSISARDNLSLFATSTQTSYEPSSGGTEFTDTLARGSWRHSYSSDTAFNASSEFELLNYDNATNTSVQIFRNQLGIDATLSPLLSFRGNAGAALVATDGGVNPLAGIGTSGLATSISSSILDWIGDAVLTYKMLKNTTLTFNASQTIAPSIVGSLYKTDNLAVGISRIINDRSTISFSATGTRSISTVTTDYATASATYGYSLTQAWNAQLTYRYQHRFASSGGGTTIDPITGTPTVSGTGAADSNSILVVVSHSYTVLPSGN